MTYAEFKLGKYKVISLQSLAQYRFRDIFTKDELQLVETAIQIQQYQLGEGPLPEGMDAKQAERFMSAKALCSLAAKASAWYEANSGKGKAIAGPFLVG